MNSVSPIVVITGGSRGIGAATAWLAAERGYHVCVNFRANQAAADAVVADIERAGGRAIAVGADLVFCCLDHERAAALEAPADTVVVDLSGAHRLVKPSLYPAWYGFEHPHAASLGNWEYAIPELFPPHGSLIANPGCYATAVLLALVPVSGLIDPAGVIVDAKSGVSGAGRTL